MNCVNLQCFPENLSVSVPSLNSHLSFYGSRSIPVYAWEFGVMRSCVRKSEIVEW